MDPPADPVPDTYANAFSEGYTETQLQIDDLVTGNPNEEQYCHARSVLGLAGVADRSEVDKAAEEYRNARLERTVRHPIHNCTVGI